MSQQKNAILPVLIGCGLVGLLCFLLCVGGFMFFVPRAMRQAGEMMEQVQQEVARQQILESFSDGWRPPAHDANGEALFPESVSNFTRLKIDTVSSPKEFGLSDLEGEHATYESTLADIDVYAYRVSEEEVRDVMQSTKDALGDNFETSTHFGMSGANYDALTFSASPPVANGCVWYSDGWLFLMLAEEQFVMSMFQTEYLEAIQSPAPEEPLAEDVEIEADSGDDQETDADRDGPDAALEADKGDFPPAPPRPEAIKPAEVNETAP